MGGYASDTICTHGSLLTSTAPVLVQEKDAQVSNNNR